MGRAWRIEYEGGLYHVLSRGNERRDIFRDDDDRLTFLDLIGDMSDQYHVDIFAYTLMNNHYHGKMGSHLFFFIEYIPAVVFPLDGMVANIVIRRTLFGMEET